MAIIKCPNNHYYDDKKTDSCPYCEKMSKGAVSYTGMNEQLTSYIDPVKMDDCAQKTEGYFESVSEYEKTIGFYIDDSRNMLTVGWLVCVEGKEKGKSYTIHSGRNFAGRSLDMDIVLSDDKMISREKHFSIVYDPKSVAFYLLCGAGHTYVNDELVSSVQTIIDSDVIRAGESKYIFIQFCKEGRDWN